MCRGKASTDQAAPALPTGTAREKPSPRSPETTRGKRNGAPNEADDRLIVDDEIVYPEVSVGVGFEEPHLRLTERTTVGGGRGRETRGGV